MSDYVRRQAWGLMCGRRLGRGVGRKVYECRLDARFVIKCETGSQSFQNIVEWETWLDVKDTPERRWFAPCLDISATGGVLIMRRTQPASPRDHPKRLPKFLTDHKRTNYGILDGKFVCHDYGTNNLPHYGLTCGSSKVDWS